MDILKTSTGKVLMYQSGGAKTGAVVNPTGNINNLYINCDMDLDSLKTITNSLSYTLWDTYRIFVGEDESPFVVIDPTGAMAGGTIEDGFCMMVASGAVIFAFFSDQVYGSTSYTKGFYRWISTGTLYPISGTISVIDDMWSGAYSGEKGTAEMEGVAIGTQNNLLTSFLSFNTPFTESSGSKKILAKE